MDEKERRQRRFALILDRFERDAEAQENWRQRSQDRAAREPEAVALLDALARDLDLEAFRAGLHAWTQRPGYEGERGMTLMFLNQIASRAAEDPEPVARLVADALRVPADEADCAGKIERFAAYVESVKRGGHPAPGRVPHLVSLFWSMQDHERWPCLWPSGEDMLKALGWIVPTDDPAERYLRFRAAALDVGVQPVVRVEQALYWFHQHPWVGLDPSLPERCAENGALIRAFEANGGYPDDAARAIAERNALAIRGELMLLARHLADDVSEALGREVTARDVQLKTAFAATAPYRADGYATWSVGAGISSANVRVWVTDTVLAAGVHPGWPREGWHDEVGRALSGKLPPRFEFFTVQPHSSGSRLVPAGGEYPGGEVFVGRVLDAQRALGDEGVADDVVAAVTALRPIVEKWVGATTPPPATPPAPDDPLAALVEEFRTTRPYPNEKDEWHHAERRALAERLTPAALEAFEPEVLRLVANGPRYGKPGPQAHLNATLTAADPQELERIGSSLAYLLWGPDDDEYRIDRVLDQNDMGFVGFGESVAMKLLAIVHPDRYVPAFPYTGDMGKAALMQLVGLESPGTKGRTRGQVQVLSNDLIRARLEPHFPDDAWAQAQFLYWLRARGERPHEDDIDVLGELAGRLLVERSFLEELVELLRDKGQIILYGPPGTGKTYLAKKLAEVLAPDPTRRMVVQFHPSTSYEDFFEGFRPDVAPGGAMTYQLRRGPLALLADHAENAPGIDHILVIDEINRANLPKVFGELLFLLEYRGESVRTLYRADEAFELPKNLLFIGTMNTADRSIALVDAALRRRFHFVPFFPNEGPMAGLLARWLEQKKEKEKDGKVPVWVAALVDMVNAELREKLGGPHLQVGPSHFMVDDLDETRLERIWAYNVYPFIEEELFGDRAAVAEYRFDRVLARYRATEAGPVAADGGEPADDGA